MEGRLSNDRSSPKMINCAKRPASKKQESLVSLNLVSEIA